MLPHIAKKLEITEEHLLKELTKNGLKVQVKRAPEIKLSFSFGGDKQIASAAKMCFVLWSEVIGNHSAQSSLYSEFRKKLYNSIYSSGKVVWEYKPNAKIPVGLNLPLKKDWGEFVTILHVFSDINGEVKGFLRLYNSINFFLYLGIDVENKDKSITLFSNPETLEWDCVENFRLGIKINFYVNEQANPKELNDALAKLADYALKKQQTANSEKLVSESINESIPSQDQIITSEHVAQLSERIATALVSQVIDQNYEKLIPKELANQIIAEIKAKRTN